MPDRVFLRNRLTGVVQEIDAEARVNTGDPESAATERLWRYLLRQTIDRNIYDDRGEVVEVEREPKFEQVTEEAALLAMSEQGLGPTAEMRARYGRG